VELLIAVTPDPESKLPCLLRLPFAGGMVLRTSGTSPTARAAGTRALQIVVDSPEQYAYQFTGQRATTVRRALPCGDYGITVGGRLVASVERKSLADLVASLTTGKLHYALAELAALPRAAVVLPLLGPL
jgi:ERCC4-type nuclease